MLGRLRGLEELAVNSDDVDRRASFPLCGKRLVELPETWRHMTKARCRPSLPKCATRLHGWISSKYLAHSRRTT